MIASGTLNRRIEIQEQTTKQDEYGQAVQTWSSVWNCWASIAIQQTQLIYSTAEFMDKNAYRITIRWTPSVIFTAKQRVMYTDQTKGIVHIYTIEAIVNENQANEQITLMCYILDGAE